MDPRDEIEHSQFEPLTSAFRDQLLACLEECARGRRGLFAEHATADAEDAEHNWPEAARLRELAVALQSILAQAGETQAGETQTGDTQTGETQAGETAALCDEFLDLCSIHGESDPGERRLARAFLDRIEKNQVGSNAGQDPKPW